jgi:hypothetical protein
MLGKHHPSQNRSGYHANEMRQNLDLGLNFDYTSGEEVWGTQSLYLHCRERIVAIKTFLSYLLSVSIQNQLIQHCFFQRVMNAQHCLPSLLMVASGFPIVTQVCRAAGFSDPNQSTGACRPRSNPSSPRCNTVGLNEYSFCYRRRQGVHFRLPWYCA